MNVVIATSPVNDGEPTVYGPYREAADAATACDVLVHKGYFAHVCPLIVDVHSAPPVLDVLG